VPSSYIFVTTKLTILGTARLSLRSGAHITVEDSRKTLEPAGPLEGLCLQNIQLASGNTATCLATFVYVEDCNDAVKVCGA
jgi:hypothetical protein